MRWHLVPCKYPNNQRRRKCEVKESPSWKEIPNTWNKKDGAFREQTLFSSSEDPQLPFLNVRCKGDLWYSLLCQLVLFHKVKRQLGVIIIKKACCSASSCRCYKNYLSDYFNSSFGYCLQKFTQSLAHRYADVLRTLREIKAKKNWVLSPKEWTVYLGN